MAIPSGTSTRKPRMKCHWQREEDDRLTLLVKTLGPQKWDRIASCIPGRTGKSCRIRWLNQLDPRVNKAPFTPQENQMLIELHKKYGNRWSTIAHHFPFRTDNHVKNQYHVLTGKRCLRSTRNIDPHCTLPEGSTGVGPVGSQFTEMGPIPIYGSVETLTRIGSPILRRLGLDSSVVGGAYSDASSALIEEMGPIPQQEVGIEKYQFIDFLGVESLE